MRNRTPEETAVPKNSTIAIFVIALAAAPAVRAQDSRLNTNAGGGLTTPLNPTAGFAGVSGHIVVGAGYNITRHHSFVGQFMWSHLPSNRDALLPIWRFTDDTTIHGSSELFAVTGNYRFRLQGKTYGAYFIGGGGFYRRTTSLSREVVPDRDTACAPAWEWWGFACESGIVSRDLTLLRKGVSAFGANGGIGFTIRINEEGYKFYIESRYHFAPTGRISTQIIPISFGFSW